jgi:hypothetical protein
MSCSANIDCLMVDVVTRAHRRTGGYRPEPLLRSRSANRKADSALFVKLANGSEGFYWVYWKSDDWRWMLASYHEFEQEGG